MTKLNAPIYTFVQTTGTNLDSNILIIYFVFVYLDNYYLCVKTGKKQNQDEEVIIVVTKIPSTEYHRQLSADQTLIVDKLWIEIHKTPSYPFVQVRFEWKYLDNIPAGYLVIIDSNFNQDESCQDENSNGIRIFKEGDESPLRCSCCVDS